MVKSNIPPENNILGSVKVSKDRKNTIKTNLPRRVLQLGVLFLIVLFAVNLFSLAKKVNPEAYCPFGGIQALSSFFVNDTLACDMTTVQITLGILLVFAVFSLGKLFCAYLCPLGFVSELLTKFRRFSNIKEIVIKDNSFLDKLLRSVKYILLFIVFYISISSSELFCKQFDPYYALATGFKGEINLWLSFIAIYVLIIGCFFFKMFWCKYICPLGAVTNIFKYFLTAVFLLLIYYVSSVLGLKWPWQLLLALICLLGYLCELFFKHVKIFPLLKIKRDKDKCPENCRDCVKKCPYNILINETDTVKHLDCTMCCDCISECQYNSIHL